MRLSLFLMLIAIFQLSAESAYSQSVSLSFSLNNKSIEEVLDKIEQETEFSFLVLDKQLDMDKQVSIQANRNSIEQILDNVFNNTNIQYRVVDRQIILMEKNLHPQIAQQSRKQIKGTITDERGEPIIGANVVEKGTSNGIITDLDGKFSLSVSENAVAVISYIGYITQEIRIGNQTNMSVQLREDSQTLEEVVVIGYGEYSKKKLSTAISKIPGKEINKLPVAMAEDALAGLAAGVQVQSGAGSTPGEAPIIRIRGVGSLGAANDPLYVVDGYPLQNAAHFSRMNVSDIESIEILKDAASAAIYGSRAANGVVIVTTKRGKAGKMSFNVNAYTGFQQVANRMEVMNKNEYLSYVKDATTQRNTKYPDIFDRPGELPDTDWQDVIFRTAPMSEIQISGQGGSEKTQFAISGSYLSQDGILKGTDYELLTLRANIDSDLTKNLRIGANFAPSFVKQGRQSVGGTYHEGPASNNPVYTAILLPPVIPVWLENGDYGQANVLPFSQNGLLEPNTYNPLAVLEQYKDKVNSFRIMNNIYLQWTPLEGLLLKSQGGISVETWTVTQYIPSTLAHNGAIFANISNPQLSGIRSSVNNVRTVDWVWENTATYTKRLDSGHNFSGLLLFSMQKYNSTATATTGKAGTFTNDLIHNPTAATEQLGSVSYGLNSYMSYAARLNYDYKDKYLFSAAIRTDASSKFGADKRYATFPSFSAGWRITKESFMENQDILSELKVRGSYGETGNANIGDFTWMSSIGYNNYSFNGQRVSGTYQNGYFNSELTWEKNRQVDLGLEAGFLNDRIYVSIDFYEKITKGMLFSKELPGILGYASSFKTNIGKLRNQGYEVTLNTRNLEGDFSWTTDLNLSYNRSKVLDLGGRESLNPMAGTSGWDNVYRIEVGKPIGNMYGFIIDGVIKKQEELDSQPQWAGSGVGDFAVRNTNGDDKVDAQDRTLLGNGLPDYVYGMTNNFSYKGFDLSIILQGTLGSSIINGTSRHNELFTGSTNVTKEMVNNYFLPDQPDRNVKFARLNRAGFNTARELSSYAVYDGDFLRVRNITIGYTLPSVLSRKMFLQSARVYVSGQNLLTFTKYPGFNPEPSQYGASVYQPGSDQGTYPVSRSVMFGVNLSF